jgi:RNA polymerase sigma-70 factor (ECF subfamily)
MAISNEAEFRALYDEHFDDVRRFVRRRADPAGVDDVVGETFLIAWRRRRELPADPRPWLFRTARNVLLNDSRRRRRHDSLAVRIAAQADLSLSVAQPLADAESLIDLAVAWRRLSPADQEVLALPVWEELPDRDAAAVLGCARATYSMRLSRARRRLGALLGAPDAQGRPLPFPAAPAGSPAASAGSPAASAGSPAASAGSPAARAK